MYATLTELDTTQGLDGGQVLPMERSNDFTEQTQALLDAGARGDDRAYDRLLARASDRLLGLARRMLRRYPHLQRWEQTDDVFQNAAIRLHRSLQNLRPDTVRGFLGLATVEIRRTLIDLIRHHFGPEGAAGKYRSDFKGDPDDDKGGLLENEPDRHENLESLEVWSRFHEAMDQLPADEQEVMHLMWYGGIKQREVATLLGISLPTVKRRWYRARLRLQAVLEDDTLTDGKGN